MEKNATTLKEVRRFISRADELSRVDLKTSYFCRLYAVRCGVRLPANERSNELRRLLDEQLDSLESAKRNSSSSFEEERDRDHVETFAYSLFARADVLDRKRRERTKKVASLFFVAANVLDVAKSMAKQAEAEEDEFEGGKAMEEKRQYAMWRAGEINRAIREGKDCEDPPEVSKGDVYDAVAALEEDSQRSLDGTPLPPTSTTNAAAAATDDSRNADTHTSDEAKKNGTATMTTKNRKGPPPGVGFSKENNEVPKLLVVAKKKEEMRVVDEIKSTDHYDKIAKAQVHAKSAMSALGFEDVKTAIEQLEVALRILEK